MDKTELLKRANQLGKNNLIEELGIEFVDIGDDFIKATMPVTPKVHQPMGLLHGGATAALAESLGSCGSFLLMHEGGKGVVGIEINANHLRSTEEGIVTAEGKLLHKGRRTHVWDIRVSNEEGKMLSICRLTNMILD